MNLTQTDDCQRNQTGFYANNTQKCQNCSPSCTFCDSLSCYQCAPGFYLTTDFLTNVSTCSPCMSNCSTCYPKAKNDTTLKCLECMNQNMLDLQTNTTCTFNQTSCMHGFYYNTTTLTCAQCQQGCIVCQNDSSCLQCDMMRNLTYNTTSQKCEAMNNNTQQTCPLGQFVNTTNQMCQNCSPNCSQCINSTICMQCNDDTNLTMYQNGTSQCTPKNNTIQNCSTGFFFNNQYSFCQPCPYGCAECSNLQNCTKCTSQQFILSENKMCIDQCQKNETQTKNLFWNSDQNQCQECLPNCSNCTYNKTTKQADCSYCNLGYESFINNSSNQSQCQVIDCNQQGVYVISNEPKLCGYCNYGCKNCTKYDTCDFCIDNFQKQMYSWMNIDYSYCTKNCPLGTFMKNEETGECQQCSANCDFCSDVTNCFSCKDTFYLNYNFTTNNTNSTDNNVTNEVCKACPQENCLKCYYNPMNTTQSLSNVYCYFCKDGYTVDWNTQQCVPAMNCSTGYYFDQSFLKCMPCKTYGCDKCGQFTNCTKCLPGFTLLQNQTCQNNCQATGQYFNLSQNTCMNCLDTEGCLQCKDGQSCSVCKQGYSQFLDTTTGISKCLKCPNNCNYCQVKLQANSTTTPIVTCSQCENNYIWNITTKMCEAATCPVSNYFDKYQQRCANCSQGCKTCSSLTQCTECNITDGSITLFNNSCQPTCKVQMYQQQTQFNITSWLYFDPPTKTCKNCSIQNCGNCHYDTPQSTELCGRCQPGYQLSADNTTCTAIDCNQAGVYHNGSVCEYCSKGCLSCTDRYNCQTCMNDMVQDWSGQCKPICTANQFYNMTNQSCQTCGDENCTQCDSSTGKCQRCSQGMTLWDTTVQQQLNCTKCPENCTQCNLSNLTDMSSAICTQCSPYSKLNSQGQCQPIDTCQEKEYFDWGCMQCQKCSKGCKSCNGPFNCTECEADFNLSYNQCHLKCSNGTFYNFSNMTCDNCTSNCLQCNSNQNCGKCQQGYALMYNRSLTFENMQNSNHNDSSLPLLIEGATCQKCQDNCNDCFMNQDSTLTCLSCQFGYKMINGSCTLQTCPDGTFFDSKFDKCLKCPYNCSKCNSPFDCTECSAKYLAVSNGQCLDKCQMQTQTTGIFQYYDNQTEKCTPCNDNNCKSCSNSTNCFKCDAGFSLLNKNNTSQCLMCPTHCGSCNQTDANSSILCNKCEVGYEKNSTGDCVPISCLSDKTFQIPNSTLCDYCSFGCKNCTSKYNCSSCLPDFQMNYWNGQCMSNCTQGQFLDQSLLKCDNCPSNCNFCQSKTTCNNCKMGYYQLPSNYTASLKPLWDSASQVCMNCSKGCDNCTLTYTQSEIDTFLSNSSHTVYDLQPKCMMCAPGYILNNSTGLCDKNASCPRSDMYFNISLDRCLPCSFGCDKCEQLTQCQACANNFTMNITSGFCVPLYNSTYQNYTNSTNNFNNQSSICGNSSYFDPQANQCMSCSMGCQSCSNNSTCFLCLPGFQLTWQNSSNNQSNSTTQTCQYMPPNNSFNGNQTNCNRTNEYFDIMTGQCIQCVPGCKECNHEGTCVSCMTGLNLIETTSLRNLCKETCPLESISMMLRDGSMRCQHCNQGCASCNQTQCIECKQGLVLFLDGSHTSHCLAQCPSNTFFNDATMRCEKCSTDCLSCNGPLSSNCTSCGINKVLNQDNRTCQNACSSLAQFVDYQDSNTCKQCDASCSSCMYNSTFCTSCADNTKILDKYAHQCVSSITKTCNSTQYLNLQTQDCETCNKNCKTCTGPNEGECTLCPLLTFAMQNEQANSTFKCMNLCPDGFFGNQSTRMCDTCPSVCSKCQGIGNSVVCSECKSPNVLHKGQCLEVCPSNTYQNGTQCVQCSENCLTCSAIECTKCKDGFQKVVTSNGTGTLKTAYLAQQCFVATAATCRYGTYFDQTLSQCVACNQGCLTCNSSTQCTSSCSSNVKDCIDNSQFGLGCNVGDIFIKEANICTSKCELVPGYFTNSVTQNCDKCQTGCSSCIDLSTCSQCQQGFYSFMHPITNKLHCVKDCVALSQQVQDIPKLFNDEKTSTCQLCKEDCQRCSSYQTCDVCNPFSAKVLGWYGDQCSCLFNYQVIPAIQKQQLRIITQDINWFPSLMNVTLPCSTYFKILRKEVNLCLPWYLQPQYQNSSSYYLMQNQNQSYNNQTQQASFVEVKGISMLDAQLCQAMSYIRPIYMKEVDNYIHVQETEIIMHQLKEEHLQSILKKDVVLKLNENNFVRKNCVNNAGLIDNYQLKFVDALWINDKVYDWQKNDSYPNNNGTGPNGNNSNSTNNPPQIDNGTIGMGNSSVNLKLNTQALRIYKCSPLDQSLIQILYSVGFETGFKQLIWDLNIIEELTKLKHQNNMSQQSNNTNQNTSNNTNNTQNNTSNTNNTQNTTQNQTGVNNNNTMLMQVSSNNDYIYINYTDLEQQIQSIEVNSKDSQYLSLQGLVATLPSEVQLLFLNITLRAINMQDQLVTKYIQVVLINSNRIEMAQENTQAKIAPQVEYQIAPLLIEYSCQGIKTIRLNSLQILDQYNLTMSCVLMTSNNQSIAYLQQCVINPWTLTPGRDYRVKYMVVDLNTERMFEGLQSISVEEVTPYCKIAQGSQLMVQPNVDTKLNAVVKEDIDIKNYKLQWTCSHLDVKTSKYVECLTSMNKQQNITLDYIIPANSLEQSSQYFIQLNIFQIDSNIRLASCSVQVQTALSAEYKVIGLQILGEVDSRNSLKLATKSFVFSCQTTQNITSNDFFYYWTLTTTTDASVSQINLSNISIATSTGKYLKVDQAAFTLNSDYVLSCQVKSNQLLAFGSTSLEFNTRAIQDDSSSLLSLQINPSDTGIAYQTNFTITASTLSSSLFYCILAYSQNSNNQNVVLYQSKSFEQYVKLNQILVLPSGSINILLQCQDTSGNMRTITKTIQVSKIVVDTNNTNAISQMLLEGAESNNSMAILQALKLAQDLGSTSTILNATAQASLLKNSLQKLILQTSNDNETSSTATLLDSNTKISLIQSITDSMKSNTQLATDKTLVQMALQAFIKTVNDSNSAGGMQNTNESNSNQSSIERRLNGIVVQATVIEPEQFEQQIKLAGDILSQSKAASLSQQERREVVATCLSILDSQSANLESGEQQNETVGSGELAYSLLKVAKDTTANPLNNKVSLSMNKEEGGEIIEISFNASDPVFSAYENVIFKAISFDKDMLSDSQNTPLSMNVSNADTGMEMTFTSQMNLFSDVLIISVDNTPDLYPIGQSYQLNQTQVNQSKDDMIMPILFDITLADLATQLPDTVTIISDNKNVTIQKEYQCQTFNEQLQQWEKLECQVENDAYSVDNKIKCCTRHLSMFAIVEITNTTEIINRADMTLEYSDDNFVRVVTISFDLFFIIFAIIGCILDKYNILTMYNKLAGNSHPSNQNKMNNDFNSLSQQQQEQQRRYGDRTKQRQEDMAAYEQQYMQNLQNQNMQSPGPLSFDNSMMNQTQFPILAGNIPTPKPMDGKVRPPMKGHKVSEQDADQQRYEGGSSEEDDESQNVHVRAKQLKKNRDEKKRQKMDSKKPSQMSGAGSGMKVDAPESQNKLFQKVKGNDNRGDTNDQNVEKKKSKKVKKQKKEQVDNQQDSNDVSRNSDEVKKINKKAKKDSALQSVDEDDNSSKGDYHDQVMTKGGDQDDTHRGGFNGKKKNNKKGKTSQVKNVKNASPGGKLVLPSQGILQPDDSESSNNNESSARNEDNDDRPEDHSAARVLGPNNPQDTGNKQHAYDQNNEGNFKDVTFSDVFFRAIKCYHRVVGVIFSEAPNYYRFLKVINSCAQFFLVLLITGLLTLLAEMNSGGAFIVTLILMRFIQILFNIAGSKSLQVTSACNCRNTACAILFFAIFIIAQAISMGLSRDRYQDELDEWKQAFLITILMEILLFDFLINPMVILLSLKLWCIRASYRFLSPGLTQKFISDADRRNNYNTPNGEYDSNKLGNQGFFQNKITLQLNDEYGYQKQNQHDQSIDDNRYKQRPVIK